MYSPSESRNFVVANFNSVEKQAHTATWSPRPALCNAFYLERNRDELFTTLQRRVALSNIQTFGAACCRAAGDGILG